MAPPRFVIGSSPAMQAMHAMAERLAVCDRPVLVTGPTGAGKEVAVQLVHALSERSAQPLLAVNCGAMPEALIEAHLFGHERGAFTGADGQREGYCAAVKGGTLFLDEVAELPLTLQPKLLRVLESRMFRPLGAVGEQRFQGRIVAATHRDLARMVAAGTFREDLYYRLNVFELRVPGLAERREDIPELVRFFAAQQPRRLHFTEAALAVLAHVTWQGNVRQLRNVIDRICILTDDDQIDAETVRRFVLGGANEPPGETFNRLEAMVAALLQLDHKNKLEAVVNAMITQALKDAAGNKSAAARLLGVHRKFIERRVLESPAG